MPILDDFNRADEDPLSGGGRWGALGTVPQMKIVSNEATVQTGVESYSRYLTTFLPDIEVSMRFADTPGNLTLKIFLGLQNGHLDTWTGYEFYFLDSEGRSISVGSIVNGVPTGNGVQLTDAFPATATNDLLSFSRRGNVLSVKANGVVYLQWTDTIAPLQGPGQVAFGAGGAGNSYDDFSVTTLSPIALTQSRSARRRI